MTYFNRKYQLDKTLLSLTKSNHKNFSVVIVDDASTDKLVIEKEYPFNIEVINITPEEKTWTNPEPAYNRGILKALELNPAIIMLQNAECYHNDDVLLCTETELNDTNYLSFACFSLDEPTTFSDHALNDIVHSNNRCAVYNGECAWYNHSEIRPVAYDFCSAITVNNLKLLNGYDERFSSGNAYGDNYLLNRVKMLDLYIMIIDYPFVVHQWHYNIPPHPDHPALADKNLKLLDELTMKGDYRAVHLYTPDL